jgi:hypothetical protein
VIECNKVYVFLIVDGDHAEVKNSEFTNYHHMWLFVAEVCNVESKLYFLLPSLNLFNVSCH